GHRKKSPAARDTADTAPVPARTAGNTRNPKAGDTPPPRGQHPDGTSSGDLPRGLAEADARGAVVLAVALLHDLVAVLEEGARLAVRQRERRLPGLRELHQRAVRVGRRARERAGAEEVARAQVAAVRAVVRDELRHGPIGVAEVAARKPRRRFHP